MLELLALMLRVAAFGGGGGIAGHGLVLLAALTLIKFGAGAGKHGGRR